MQGGRCQGEVIPEDQFQRELDRYYDARGWNRDGVPLKETFEELDLPDVGETLGATHELSA